MLAYTDATLAKPLASAYRPPAQKYIFEGPLLPISRTALSLRLPKRAASQRTNLLTVHAGSDAEVEVAVFRFTLGIPGFDDIYIPRVIGSLGVLVLAANHFLGADVISGAQTRSEVFAAFLAAICIASPTIEARLKELEPGRGRQAAPLQVAGATSIFGIAPDVQDERKQELAWASYALLRNTNSCGVVVFHDNQAVLARGAVGPAAATVEAPANTGDCLQQLSQAHDVIKRQRVEEQSMDKGALAYLQDKGAIASASTIGWNGLVADGVNSLLVCHGGSITAGDDGIMLVLLSDKPRAWSKRERLWALAITNKLDSCWA